MRTRSTWAFFGFLIAIMLFSFFLFFTTRDRAYFFYFLFLFSLGVFLLESFKTLQDAFFFREYPKTLQYANYIVLAVMDISYIYFIRYFMNLGIILPKWDRIMKYLVRGRLGVLLGGLIFYHITFDEPLTDIIVIGFVIVLYGFVAALMIPLFRVKDRIGYFIIGATCTLIMGIIINGILIIKGRGVSESVTLWALGVAILLFALGLAYRVRKMQIEKQEIRRIKDLNELKTRLYHNITHEFRTPLTVIQGIASQIQSAMPSGGQWSKGLEMIRRNGDNLLRLVNRLLELAKLESGRETLNLQQSDIIPYLRYLVESFESLAAGKDIYIRFLTNLEYLVMDFDVEKIRQIMSNLLSNAIKFTPGGGEITVKAEKEPDGNDTRLCLRIKDTGEGIAPDELTHIFDRFYQADSTVKKKGQGTGIGLALTKELVNLMDGTIGVKSVLGKGTEFSIRFPITQNAEKPASEKDLFESIPKAEKDFPAIPESIGPESPPVMLSPEKPILLIIEDHADVVHYLKSILEPTFLIETAHNGQVGIDRAMESIPDLIISDVMMPEKDGFEVCETLKGDHRTSHIPIILLTARTALEDKIAGLKRGADVYLAKPFHKEELMVRLDQLLENRRRLQKHYQNLSKTLVTDHENPTLENEFIRKAQKTVEENMDDEDFGVLKFCRDMRMSRTQMHRKIKALTDKSTTEFIRSVRLHRAMDLLKNTPLNISEIAYEVGFRDPNYFTRAFKEAYGIKPSETRK